jgi:hypothetical protein
VSITPEKLEFLADWLDRYDASEGIGDQAVQDDLRDLARELRLGPSVRFYFSDATPVAQCQCGVRCFGDAAVDAFGSWWKHRYEKHPEADG